MRLSDIAFEEGWHDREWIPATVQSTEILLFEHGLPLTFHEPVRPEQLAHWVERRGLFEHHDVRKYGRPAGGLRLLTFDLPHTPVSSSRIMPFQKEDFRMMTTRLSLPEEYVYDSFDRFARSYVTSCTTNPASANSKGLGLIFVSPRLGDGMDLVLSYDASTRITTGFLRFYFTRASPLKYLLPRLEKCAEMAAHPMLLPALAYGAWYRSMAISFDFVHEKMTTDVQAQTGLMKGYYFTEEGHPTNAADIDRNGLRENTDLIHETIVTQHAFLTNALSPFVKDFGLELLAGIEKLKEFKLERNLCEEIQAFIERLNVRTNVELKHREQLLSRVEIQLQVLYNVMQQGDSTTNIQIAEETKRDSSAMKALALITTVFLPMTAMAAIFSMSSFFSTNPNDGSRIEVSSQFWIFWAVVGPLTVVLLSVFVLWINRKQLWLSGSRTAAYYTDGQDSEKAANDPDLYTANSSTRSVARSLIGRQSPATGYSHNRQ